MKKKQIVGSLTTISSRINTIHLVVNSLKRQTKQIDKLFLYISKEPYLLDKGIQTIPENLNPFIKSGFLYRLWIFNC